MRVSISRRSSASGHKKRCIVAFAMALASLPRRAHLGFTLDRVAGTADGRALVIGGVRPGSSADLAGVLAGDRLLCFDGKRLTGSADVRNSARGLAVGAHFELVVERSGVELTLSGVAIALPTEEYSNARVLLEEVRAGDQRLRAIVVLPERPGPHPVVYYLPAAHWASEEYPFEPRHPVRALIAALASAGFASVRVERSGMGDSVGPACNELDFEAELHGYRSGLELVSRAPWARADAILLFGHSLGGMLAPLLARQQPVSGIAVFGTTAQRLQQSLVDAARRRAMLRGLEGAKLSAFLEPLAELIELVIVEGLTPREARELRTDLRGVGTEWYIDDRVFDRSARFYQQLQTYDLEAVWKSVEPPVLALHGSADWVTTPQDAQQIASVVGQRGTYQELPGVDHYLRSVVEGEPGDASPDLSNTVTSWFGERLRVR